MLCAAVSSSGLSRGIYSVRPLNRLAECFDSALNLFTLVHKPVGRPDAMEAPTEGFQLMLAEPVPIPSVYSNWTEVVPAARDTVCD